MSSAKKKSRRKSRKKIGNTIKSIPEIALARTGGQNALTGYSYQLLYSCYLLLTELDDNTSVRMEGVEDIDVCRLENNKKCYIQLKYSKNKKNASFLDNILKNFLEVYMADKTCSFELVYDFEADDGNLSKLLTKELDVKSFDFWNKKIDNIFSEEVWDCKDFSVEDFLNEIQFQYKSRNDLEFDIEKLLIDKCKLMTSNQLQYINALKVFCFDAMKDRRFITKKNVSDLLSSVHDDINKGVINPSASYFLRVDFDSNDVALATNDYYEGKKATLSDIINKLPVHRYECEREIEESIQNNTVTVIKSSSGQGKTTLAWQVAYNLKDSYSVYQLKNCNDRNDVFHIADYVKTKVTVGQKILLVLDNLNIQLKEWNALAQELEQSVGMHYKILVTTREDDWYLFSGALHDVKSVHIINIKLDELTAQGIYNILKQHGNIHKEITDWHSAWERVAGRKLLIEYVYLLTHGEMLADRIDEQIRRLGQSEDGKFIFEILRCVCFADICGIQLSTSKLLGLLEQKSQFDVSESLRRLKDEFLIKLETKENYIEGLHPVRSQHVVDRLNDFKSVNDTIIQVVKITDKKFLPILFSCFPKYIRDYKAEFYREIIPIINTDMSLENYTFGFQGLFSGTAIQYFENNKIYFDKADEHFGAELLVGDSNPFIAKRNVFEEIKGTSQNENLVELNKLSKALPKLDIKRSDIYLFSEELFQYLKNIPIDKGLPSFVKLANWIYMIDNSFVLVDKIDLDSLWGKKEDYSLELWKLLLYIFYVETPDAYFKFFNNHKFELFSYVKKQTNSLKIFEKGEDIHIQFVFLNYNQKLANEESVFRTNTLARIFPFYSRFCVDIKRPKIDAVSIYKLPNTGHKGIPSDYFSKLFRSDFGFLWSKSIISQYECQSVYDWLYGWISIRQCIVDYFENAYKFICSRLRKEKGNSFVDIIVKNGLIINNFLGRLHIYPHSERPFEERIQSIEKFKNIKSQYFVKVNNYVNQFLSLINKNEQKDLAVYNLRDASFHLTDMQRWFCDFVQVHNLFIDENEKLIIDETQTMKKLLIACDYYIQFQPSEYFSIYSMQKWSDSYEKTLLYNIKEDMSDLASRFSVIFPMDYIHDMIKIYPLVITNFDIQSNDALQILSLCLLPILKYYNESFYYIDIAFANNRQLITSGIRFTASFLFDLKKCLDTSDGTEVRNYPIPLAPDYFTEKFLLCFSEKFKVFKSDSNLKFDNLLNKLWEYSVYRDCLTEKEDAQYAQDVFQRLDKEIENLCAEITSKDKNNRYNFLLDLCKNIKSGMSFSDKEYNEQFNKIISSPVLIY